MSRAYSSDLRGRVLEAAANGSARGAAEQFDVGVATAIRWVRRLRETGERTARRQGQPKGSGIDVHEAFLLALIERTPDVTLTEICEAMAKEQGVATSRSTLCRFFKRRGITFKKNSSRRRTGPGGRRRSA